MLRAWVPVDPPPGAGRTIGRWWSCWRAQLYRRDHGDDPPSDKALVGPYLESLPDDGLGDQDKAVGGGETTPEGAGE